MITIKIGYDECMQGGASQWCTFYIEEDFQNFFDYDGEQTYKNQLAPVGYDKRVQPLRERFMEQFHEIHSIDDCINKIRGLIYLEDEDGFTYY